MYLVAARYARYRSRSGPPIRPWTRRARRTRCPSVVGGYRSQDEAGSCSTALSAAARAGPSEALCLQKRRRGRWDNACVYCASCSANKFFAVLACKTLALCGSLHTAVQCFREIELRH